MSSNTSSTNTHTNFTITPAPKILVNSSITNGTMNYKDMVLVSSLLASILGFVIGYEYYIDYKKPMGGITPTPENLPQDLFWIRNTEDDIMSIMRNDGNESEIDYYT